MKYTNLDLVQAILSRLDSDEVNSCSDTVESRQVLQIVRQTYFNILSRANMPEHKKVFNLDASTDPDLPVLMYRPSDVTNIEWIQYMDTSTGDDIYQYVTILPFQQFFDTVKQMNDQTDPTWDSLTLDGTEFFYRNDGTPLYCTLLTNGTIVFDGYNSAIDSTLQSTKTTAYGLMMPVYELTDAFIPDLDDQRFPLLLNEATSQAFLELKQIANDQAVRDSKRQWISLQRTKDLVKPNAYKQLPNYGRR